MWVLVGKGPEEQEEAAQIPQEAAAVSVEAYAGGGEDWHEGFPVSFLISPLAVRVGAWFRPAFFPVIPPLS